MVIFAVQNAIADPPFSHIDLISCRNLLIYLEPDLQKELVSLFHYALNPGAFLFLEARRASEALRITSMRWTGSGSSTDGRGPRHATGPSRPLACRLP